MSSTTVAEFANELKKPADTLLEQLRAAGVSKSAPTDGLSEDDKQKLLAHLKQSHGTGERKKITLTKKSTTEIKQADASGKARTIHVEVRKKRTFIKRDDGTDAQGASHADEAEVTEAAPAPAVPVIDEAELARRAQEEARQAELMRRQEEEATARRLEREAAEAREREQQEAAAKAERERAEAEQREAASRVAGTPASEAAGEAAVSASPARVISSSRAPGNAIRIGECVAMMTCAWADRWIS